jgi:hypothetical protein
MEPRVRVLETHVEYIRGSIGIETPTDAVRSDVSWLKVEMGKLTTNVSHLPSKGFVVSAAVGTITFIVAILTIFSRLGFLTPGK